MTDKDGSIVTFNVGGVVYQVRRSLLETFPNTMLARSASKQWTDGDNEKPIFIDQDGQRFRFCLEYMRNGNVQLPSTESKVALLNDLQYYGFENVDPDSINDSRDIAEAVSDVHAHAVKAKNKIEEIGQNIWDMTKHMTLVTQLFSQNKITENQMKAMEQTLRDMQKQETHEEQAFFLFKEFTSGRKSFVFSEGTPMPKEKKAFDFFVDIDMEYFQPVLAAHGLKIVNLHGDPSTVIFSLERAQASIGNY